MTDHDALLRFHRDLVETPSVSHEEGPIADFVAHWLSSRGASVERIGDNVLARAGSGPGLVLCSHLDTVPATDAWSRDPFEVQREEDRIYGLGSNDAKASVAAMTFAFLDVLERGGPCEVALLLVPEEETGGDGAEVSWPHLKATGFETRGVVVGEPTALEIATSQKGMLILELTARGDACQRERRGDRCAERRPRAGEGHRGARRSRPRSGASAAWQDDPRADAHPSW